VSSELLTESRIISYYYRISPQGWLNSSLAYRCCDRSYRYWKRQDYIRVKQCSVTLSCQGAR